MPRKTSDVTDTQFPFDEDTVPFILVVNDRGQDFALSEPGISDKDYQRGYATGWTVDKKRDLIDLTEQMQGEDVECSLLAVWPGAKQSHVFLVDDLDEARDALG